jgi:signal peptidase I
VLPVSVGMQQPRVPGEREEQKRTPRKPPRPLIALAALAVAAPILLRAFVLEAFKIPAGSMYPSLLIGDHLFITKWGHGCEGCAPERGRAFVFQYPDPSAPPVDYVKRVIALPGDRLEVQSGELVINGWRVPRCELGHANVTEPEGQEHGYRVFVEFLAGHAYLVALEDERDEGFQGPYQVAEGEAWVLGDNRNNSSDSRAWNRGKGAGVPFGNFRGPVWRLWLPPERFGARSESAPVLPAELSSLTPALVACMAKAPSLAGSTPPKP